MVQADLRPDDDAAFVVIWWRGRRGQSDAFRFVV
jgi:hypothetical protein